MSRVDVHECEFPEVEVLDDDEVGPLRAGMKVLVPCPRCGELPRDHLEILGSHLDDATRALAAAKPAMPLFHWSPASRRKQIQRYGLRPFSRTTTSSARFAVVCFADSPSWAWALSGGMRWTPAGEWDLWQTDLTRLTEVTILPSEDRLTGIHEVRTTERVYKRDLWHVGTRLKPATGR